MELDLSSKKKIIDTLNTLGLQAKEYTYRPSHIQIERKDKKVFFGCRFHNEYFKQDQLETGKGYILEHYGDSFFSKYYLSMSDLTTDLEKISSSISDEDFAWMGIEEEHFIRISSVQTMILNVDESRQFIKSIFSNETSDTIIGMIATSVIN